MPETIESNGGTLRPFQPGQSGNPGGKTSEQRRLEIENAARATRIRSALLAKLEEHIDPVTGLFTDDLTGEVLKLVKDSEDRGLGAPQQTVAAEIGITGITRRIVRASD